MSALVSRGSKYSDADRREAASAYLACGSVAKTSETTGIARRTLAGWIKSEWWEPLTTELRQDGGELELVSGKVGKVVEAKVGRPTSFKPEYAEQARQLCLLGATDKDLADFFKVTDRTIDNWKEAHPEFFRSLTEGKVVADANVAERLYERAMGYSHPEEKVLQFQGKVIRATTTKHYPPDYQSMALWLKNRQSKKWTDTNHIQVDTVQHTAVTILRPELVAKMNKAAGIEVIEGDCERVGEQ